MQKQQINARVTDVIAKTIQDKAAACEETQGGYLALIAQQWYANGCPPVNAYEAKLRTQRQQQAPVP